MSAVVEPLISISQLDLCEKTRKMYAGNPFVGIVAAAQWKALDNQIRYQLALERWQIGVAKHRGKRK